MAEIIVSSPRAISGYRTVGRSGSGCRLAATTPWLFVIAGDMPYVHRAFIDLVLSHGDAEADAVGIRIGRLPEPLCCDDL